MDRYFRELQITECLIKKKGRGQMTFPFYYAYTLSINNQKEQS